MDRRLQTYKRIYLLSFLYVFVCSVVGFIFIVYPGYNTYYRATFADMVEGKAYKPYVYRTLVPSAIRGVSRATPDAVKQAVNNVIGNTSTRKVLGWEKDYIYENVLFAAFLLFSLIAVALLLRRQIRFFYDYPKFVIDMAPLCAIVLLPLFFRYCSYIYDPASLLLFTGGFASLMKKNTRLFYPVFLLACVNKETSILMSALFFVMYKRDMKPLPLSFHLILQGSIWLGIKSLITYTYRNNPGSLVEFPFLSHNLTLFRSPISFGYFIAVIAFFGIVIAHGWDTKPRLLRHCFLIVFLPIVLLAVLFGRIDEFRIFYELYAISFLLAMPGFVDLFQIPVDS